MGSGHVKPTTGFSCQNKQVVEQSSLRRQKCAIAKDACGLAFHILREQTLQKGAPIWAFHGDHSA
jgi:hypothetical protein